MSIFWLMEEENILACNLQRHQHRKSIHIENIKCKIHKIFLQQGKKIEKIIIIFSQCVFGIEKADNNARKNFYDLSKLARFSRSYLFLFPASLLFQSFLSLAQITLFNRQYIFPKQAGYYRECTNVYVRYLMAFSDEASFCFSFLLFIHFISFISLPQFSAETTSQQYLCNKI